jgi:hypothetical protein
MIIPEVAPMLTCTASGDGFVYELTLRAREGQAAITKIRIGPYQFAPEYQPHPLPFGLSRGGPEPGFWMHRRTPPGWSRFRWEVAVNEPGSPTYLVANGLLKPGMAGLFQFVSFYPPGGVRAGLEVWRGQEHDDCGVSGPNYEPYFAGGHEH